MEMKQCPGCGKYGAADRTYCLHCGITLGVRCPDCRHVLPVGSRTCSVCGHSFVNTRSPRRPSLWKIMKQRAKPLLVGGVLFLLAFVLIAAAFPALQVETATAEPSLAEGTGDTLTVSGYALMAYLIGGRPASVESLRGLFGKDMAAPVQALLFGAGLGLWLLLLGTVAAVLLVLPNLRTLGKATARRVLAPLGVTVGGGGLYFALCLVLRGLLLREIGDGMTAIAMPWPLILLVAASLVSLLHTLLYLGEFRRREEREELSLSLILSIPFRVLGRLFRRVRRAWRRKETTQEDEAAIIVTPRFSSYIVLFLLSLLFTQALLSKVSHILFWFILLLPGVLFLYLLIARHALSVNMMSDTVTIEKNQPYTYDFRIDNRSPLALPFVDAQVSIPQSNSVRCTRRTVRLSLAPLSGYHMKNTVRFRFRGTYDIGVTCFYVYDPLRLFRARVDVSGLSTVYVLPRRLTREDGDALAVADSTARTVRAPQVVDKLEISDIRDYRAGDSLKSIHWKLSSKSDDFVVKDYNTGTANETLIFCDMTAHFPDEAPRAQDEAVPKPRRVSRRERKVQQRAAADRRAKSKRVKESRDTHAISGQDLEERLEQRATVATILDGNEASVATAIPETATPVAVDVHRLVSDAAYEDMNEYVADGVVELTIAAVLSELRLGHDVTLLWYDRRASGGVCAYAMRGLDEFEAIYHRFATAPLADSDKRFTALTTMVGDHPGAKQVFITAAADAPMLADLTALPGLSERSSAGAAKVVIYNPEERFEHPRERAAYLDGFGEQLALHGLSLSVATNISINRSQGGAGYEA